MVDSLEPMDLVTFLTRRTNKIRRRKIKVTNINAYDDYISLKLI